MRKRRLVDMLIRTCSREHDFAIALFPALISYALSWSVASGNAQVAALPIDHPPELRLIYPTNGSVFRGVSSIMLHAEMSDAEGIASVWFFANQKFLGIATSPPFSFCWSNVIPDGYRISVTATDKTGNSGVFQGSTILVLGAEEASGDLVVYLHSPTDGAAYAASENIPLWLWVTGRDGRYLADRQDDIVQVSFFVNGQLLTATTNPPITSTSLIWSNVATGVYSVSAQVVDRWGTLHYTLVNRFHVAGTNYTLPPLIRRQPQDRAVRAGRGGVWFSVDVAGSRPLSFQWQCDGIDIAGATGSALELPPLTTNASGSKYSVVVSNEEGYDISREARLTVLPPLLQPTTGAAVLLNNYDLGKTIMVADGTLAPATDTYAEVWAGPVDQPLRRIADANGNVQFSLCEPGFFDAGFGIIRQLEVGVPAQIQVRAWRNGMNFETASLRGVSQFFTQLTGSALPLPAIPNPAVLQLSGAIVLEPVATGEYFTGITKQKIDSDLLEIVGLSKLSDGACQIDITGQTPWPIVLQISSDLVTWDSLAMIPALFGQMPVIDRDRAGYPHQFYRLLLPGKP